MQKRTGKDHPKKNTSSNIATIKTRVQGHPISHSNTSHEATHTEDNDTNGHLKQDDNAMKDSVKMAYTTPNLAKAKSFQNDSTHDPNINKNDPTNILFQHKV